MSKRKITFEGFLNLLIDLREDFLPLTRKAAYRNLYAPKYRNWEDYFPSVVNNVAQKLERKGWVEIKDTPEGMKVTITEKGRKQVLLFKLKELKPKTAKWDRKWRVVFFDIEELFKGKRNELRRYLKQLGLKQLQESVWISPWEIRDEIKYLREILNVPHQVKWGVLNEIENEDELKNWFELN